MKIKRGTKLQINSCRKGSFKAIAEEDFDTNDTFYPVSIASGEIVEGLNHVWEAGDMIPCRGSFCEIEVLE